MRSIYWIAPLLLATVATDRLLDRAAVADVPAIVGAVPTRTVGQGPPADSALTSSWPGFRGADRDGVYREPIRVSWEGLAPMWKHPVGEGRSSFAVADGRAFTVEQRRRDEVVAAYDVMTGRQLLTSALPERFTH